MEAGKLAQVLRNVALAGILVAVLLAQGVASLRCYSCKDVGDGGCAADLIKIEQCSPPQNICLEAITVVSEAGKQNVSATIKGCELGTPINMLIGPDSSIRHKLHACSEDLCNTLVTEDFLHKPQANQTGNSSSVPGDQECYSCISTLEDQCSSQNAAVVRCPEHSPFSTFCFQGTDTVTLGFQHKITLTIFVKKCSPVLCREQGGFSTQYFDYNTTGSCCLGNLCNAARPNGGLREATYVAPLIMAAVLAITSL